jgi:hypothetical protein
MTAIILRPRARRASTDSSRSVRSEKLRVRSKGPATLNVSLMKVVEPLNIAV